MDSQVVTLMIISDIF